MELLGAVVQIILFFWAPVTRQISYFKDLSNNVQRLTSEAAELKYKRDEIRSNVEAAISVGKTRIPLVEKWLLDVSNIEAQVDSISSEFDQPSTCLNGCCADHFSRYKLGKRVVKKLKVVQDLKEKGVFNKVAESPGRLKGMEKQPSLPRGQQSTFEKTMDEIRQCIHDEENGIVGVYGMGGIGKTTLLKAINNELIRIDHFNIVIWVTVSRELHLGLIQEKIGNKLLISFNNNEDIETKRDRLFAPLKNLRYLLILDDLWDEFSLDQVGIPKPDKQNRCKIVITTRSLEVCDAMRADKSIKVRALTWEEAWTLFCETCGDVVQSSEIQPVAKKVVEECGRLPLAIKIVGGAMKRKDRKEVWEDALRALKGSLPAEVPGMEPKVFLPLKVSFDCLENDKIKLCFLYCSLFPEDHEIKIDELVRYWAMEEGFIDNVKNLEEASNKGHGILQRIQDACLLEEVSEENEDHDRYVRMHDLLRDLAIWITSPASSSSEGSKFIVKASAGLVQPPEEQMWEETVRISLMFNNIEDLQITPNCPNLVSLFLNGNRKLRTIHSSFFQLMPKLQILDLSYTSIESLPASLLLLVNLRALILTSCKHLVEVPPLGNLKELRHLDLSESGLKNFPQGIESLVKLQRLGLSCSHLTPIPCRMIYRLPCLEDLSMFAQEHVSGATFGEVRTMIHLTSLRITVSNPNSFIADDMFLQWFSGLKRFYVHFAYQFASKWWKLSSKQIIIDGCDNFPCGIEGLIKHATALCFRECKGVASLSQLVGELKILRHLSVDRFSGVECIIKWREVGDDALQFLQILHLHDFPNLEKVFDGGAPPPNARLLNLKDIQLGSCPKLRRIFSSTMVEHLRQLQVLIVYDCPEIEEIIEGVDILPHNSFPRLRYLKLMSLSKLARICRQQIIFISVEEIQVSSCPRLKKLPLLSSSIHQMKGEIKGEREWWEGLEWEDENTKSLYFTIYRELPVPPQRMYRQLNRTQSNPKCIRRLNQTESNAAATQQMRRTLSAPFDDRVDRKASSSALL